MNVTISADRAYRASRLIKKIFLTFILVSLLLPQTGFGETKELFQGDSIYNHITIHQNDSEYCMLFGRQADNRETCMDLNEPDLSIFEYTSMMFVGFLFNPETKKACLIGLGGGYIPTVFRMHLPGIKLQTVEIDPLVHQLAVKYFKFTVPSSQSITIADGRQYLRRNKERFDQIWVDAFNSDYIPAHMTTKEFLQLCRSRLSENGIVVQNVHGANQLYDAQVATFREVFAKVYIFEGNRSNNRIIVAADKPLFAPPLLKEAAQRYKGKIGKIDLLEEMGKYNPKPEFRKAPVLTDDYNPANLMLHQR